VTGKTPATNKTPAPKKTVTPPKTFALGDKLKTKVLSNPQPKLPEAAKAAKASGPVRVEMTVDEKGNVVSAKAISGNPLLRKSAEESARKARFTPTKLSGQPVKVTGVIQYNFVLQ
jgi:protein TonB